MIWVSSRMRWSRDCCCCWNEVRICSSVAKATRLARAYDDLEGRIAELAGQERLDAMRPDLDGNQIMQILGIRPGPQVGEAYRYLLERRIEQGPLSEDAATRGSVSTSMSCAASSSLMKPR